MKLLNQNALKNISGGWGIFLVSPYINGDTSDILFCGYAGKGDYRDGNTNLITSHSVPDAAIAGFLTSFDAQGNVVNPDNHNTSCPSS